jgi:rifampicin phosphotransferase
VTAVGAPVPRATVLSLRDVRFADARAVGGKAASLGELLAAGIRVPDGVVLTTDVAAMAAVDGQEFLQDVLAKLGNGPFAVRSSGIAEDGSWNSYAGLFESALNVSAGELGEAIDRTLASAGAARVAAYGSKGNDAPMAVIVQRMVVATTAGVTLTADPINGDRRACVITAVRGLGDRLVSGAALGDEWVVREDVATTRRQAEHAIDGHQAVAIAAEARRIAATRGVPMDIEWAIDDAGALWILQARPMTALPPEVSWQPPAPGAFTRQLRFGEWIHEPVTPLFESWLLTAMEERLHAQLRTWIGQRAPRPHHVIVNGWYFYSVNWLSPGSLARSLPSIMWHLIRAPRRVVGVVPSLARHSYPLYEREWRDDLLPRYRAAVAAAEARVETLSVAELPQLIDEMADLAGEYFASIAAFAGAAYKMEMNLAKFYRRHLAGTISGSHLSLLAGFEPASNPGRHAVFSLDWWFEPSATGTAAASHGANRERVVAARQAAEAAAFAALASSPRRLDAFRNLLDETQRLVPVREEHVALLTIAWPVMRRAVLRIGEALASRGLIHIPDDAFFLTHDEVLASLGGASMPSTVDVDGRRSQRVENARLVPPLLIGKVNRAIKSMWEMFPRLVGATRSERAIASGSPASAGRATGFVRVVRGPHEFDDLQPGEILVAPLTAPAWTPLFTRAAAVVTDVGSAAAHASIIAREYGIPAVVGCGDATARLRTGMRVTVDGSTGNIERA